MTTPSWREAEGAARQTARPALKSHALPSAARQLKLSGRQISALNDWVNRPKIHLKKRISVGIRVVCTSNLNDERGVLNGSTGVVTRLDAAGSAR